MLGAVRWPLLKASITCEHRATPHARSGWPSAHTPSWRDPLPGGKSAPSGARACNWRLPRAVPPPNLGTLVERRSWLPRVVLVRVVALPLDQVLAHPVAVAGVEDALHVEEDGLPQVERVLGNRPGRGLHREPPRGRWSDSARKNAGAASCCRRGGVSETWSRGRFSPPSWHAFKRASMASFARSPAPRA
eukprot:5032732-Prymnesium_polylepis.1